MSYFALISAFLYHTHNLFTHGVFRLSMYTDIFQKGFKYITILFIIQFFVGLFDERIKIFDERQKFLKFFHTPPHYF